jgi:integrase
MTTDDFSNFRRRYENALGRLADADIPESDYEAVRSFIRARDGDLAVSSLSQYINRLRILSQRSDVPLVHLDLEDVRKLFFELRNDPDAGRGGAPSETTVYNYQAALHAFANYRGDDWADEFDPDKPSQSTKTVAEEDILSQDNIAALSDAAKRPRNQALVEFLADTGARLTLTGSLRVKDVNLDGDRPTYTPNRNAIGLKGAEIKPYPIIDSAAPLRVYLTHSHPRPDEPEAAFFHSFDTPETPVTEDDGALSPSRIRETLKELAERADVEKPVNPHNWRHSAITRMWREGYDKQEIQHRVQWSLDTDMWQRYVHVTAEQMNEEIFASSGIVEDDDSLSRERKRCGTCREPLPPHAEYCPNCGAPATPAARETTDRAIESTTAGVESFTNQTDLTTIAQMLRIVNTDPDLVGHSDPSPSELPDSFGVSDSSTESSSR